MGILEVRLPVEAILRRSELLAAGLGASDTGLFARLGSGPYENTAAEEYQSGEGDNTVRTAPENNN